jgi:hypothetical protein
LCSCVDIIFCATCLFIMFFILPYNMLSYMTKFISFVGFCSSVTSQSWEDGGKVSIYSITHTSSCLSMRSKFILDKTFTLWSQNTIINIICSQRHTCISLRHY